MITFSNKKSRILDCWLQPNTERAEIYHSKEIID
ncbi:MAG: hypothetical protein BWY22_02332 [Bacteroidetes bacterium ADurb.Bin217]|nr:MAG: hypothetical protein BWY22_02332 [Bacteroidetes bacterium ADurb.Bin217]